MSGGSGCSYVGKVVDGVRGDDFESDISIERTPVDAEAVGETPEDLARKTEQWASGVDQSESRRRRPRKRTGESEAAPEPQAVVESADETETLPEVLPPQAGSAHAISSTRLERDRKTLVHELAEVIRDGADDPFVRAVDLAALRPLGEIGSMSLRDLSPRQRERVRRYRQLVVALRQDVLEPDATFGRASVVSRLDGLFEDEPIRISRVELVSRVESFGVYEPFERYEYVAGREIPMIVYVELDQFKVVRTTDDRYEVKLTQEIELYTDSDGVMVWRQPTEQVVDRCFNHRRDFFIRQLIRLPNVLNVGKYLLKIRVTDLHGGSVQERTIPIVLVADQRVVSDRRR
ncbi:MAG: hypothetical protein CMJ18_04920 [Phycisphaeraceae bacterium]|nr:hypothetical protein [Phycisphaeraceae bacterium]